MGVAVVPWHDFIGDHAFVLLRHGIIVAPPNQPLNRVDGIFGVCDALPLGWLPDQDFALIQKGHHRGCRACTFSVFDNFRGVTFHHGNARVGSSEVDADCLRHEVSPLRTIYFRGSLSMCCGAARKGALPREDGNHVRAAPLNHAASLTSIFFASVCAGFGILILRTPFDMVASTLAGSIPTGNWNAR